ncbi:MAG: pentapeptide repeat-containing protein [Myxacorys chilensis ATA2-1-KO14]|jgi:uncharacterized protein YjbI with pentapeptide repeats|nr:pentapeptide repeat-containing protein [Myxacorys chilensis ATA2-1-KO14]
MQPSDWHLSSKRYSGRSFKGQDLTGADFQNADIRGADFTGANLTDADFTNATAGLPFRTALLFLMGLSGFTGAAGFLSSLAGFWIAYQLTLDVPKLWVSIVFYVAMLLIFGIVNHYKGLFSATAIVPITVAAVIPLAGIVLTPGSGYPTAGSAGAGIAAVAVIGAVMVALAATSAKMIAGYTPAGVIIAASIAGAIVAEQSGHRDGLISLGINPNPQSVISQTLVGAKMAEIVAATVALLGVYIAAKSWTRDPRFLGITNAAVALAAVGGTSFRSTTLTRANFSRATLKNSDFRQATMTHTHWRNAKLDLARLGNSILRQPAVRHLLTSGDGRGQSFAEATLRGANLIGADLSCANFQQADLSHATLHSARLDWANLTQTQAIATDFSYAQMTGACGLGTWNIDGSTQLEQVDCRWVYLLEHPKPGTDDRERRPSSGEFATGEFTHLFREVLDTVDLIFRNGIDWRALTQSLQRVQVEHPSSQLDIQSIENKGDGIVVVRIRAHPEIDKSAIHSQFLQFYGDAIAQLNQQAKELKQHEQELQSIRSVLDDLAPRSTDHSMVVILNIGKGNFETGFPVTLQILQEGTALPSVQCIGELPPNIRIDHSYREWQSAYRRSLKAARLEVPSQVTNVSRDEFFEECFEAANCLTREMNRWLASDSFRPIEQELHMRLSCHQPIRVILQTDQPQLRQLPWQTWQFFERYTQAEVALSKIVYRSPVPITRETDVNPQVRILAIFGDGRGIDLQQDQLALATLEADVTFLVERGRHELSQTLWNQSWDILFFAGHSSSQADRLTGDICINSEQRLQIADLKSALTQAIARGLKLAIFNSCDGLGLANAIADLQIPQMIIMREPVPDSVAHLFLMHFLKRFSRGQTFYQSVREAREQLQDLEDQHPCAAWLPMIVQNPAEIPPTWQHLKHQGKISQVKGSD